jgi:hypothetical protein
LQKYSPKGMIESGLKLSCVAVLLLVALFISNEANASVLPAANGIYCAFINENNACDIRFLYF